MADQDVTLGVVFQINDQNNKRIADLEKQLGDLDKQMLDLQKDADKASSGISKAFTAIGVAAAAALAYFSSKQVIEFFEEGIDAAVKQENAMADLGQQLKLTGDYSKKALDEFAEFADEMERSSKYGDDAVLSQVALAKSFGLTNDEAKKLVKGAIELSAATGQSLDGAVQALGKTFSGVTGKLDEQIPVLKSLTKEQLAAGQALDVVIQRFGGSALAGLQNFSGQLLQTKNAFGNLQESFGDIIIKNPVVIKSIQVLGDAFRKAQEFVENNKDAISDFVSLGVKAISISVPIAVDVLGFLIKSLQGLSTVGTLAFGGLLEVVSFFGEGFKKALEFYVGAYVAFIQTILEGVDKVPLLGDALKEMGFDTKAASKGVESLGLKITDTVSSGVDSVNRLRDSTIEFAATNQQKFEEFNAGFETFQKGVDDAVQSIFDADGKVIENAEQTSNKVVDVETERANRINAIREEQAKKNTELAQKEAAEADKIYREHLAKAAKANKDFTAKRTKTLEEFFTINLDNLANNALNFIGNALNGKQGAKDQVAGIAGLASEAYLPGSGAAVSGIVGQLSAGPEQTKAMVKSFVEALPEIIEAIAESIPVVVETLVDYLINEGGAIKIGVAIIEGMFTIISSLGEAMGIELGGTFVEALQEGWDTVYNYFAEKFPLKLKEAFLAPFEYLQDIFSKFEFPSIEVPAWFSDIGDLFGNTPSWIQDLLDALNKLTSAFGGDGDGSGGFFGKIGKGDFKGAGSDFEKKTRSILGFAEGGRVPDGYPDDSYVARLTSRERVLNVAETQSLDKLIASGKLGGQDLTPLIGMLAQISAQLESQQTSVDLKVNSDVFARMILNLTRRGARLSA